jgi:arylsulfatase A-like enzyme
VHVLLITLDQFRAEAMGCAGHPLVHTPALDLLAAHGVRFARHYTQATPCSPGRAAIYTGTYQMNNRVVANGTPLDTRFDNVAKAARRAGYDPALFGYTDQSVDPRVVSDPEDPRLHSYTGVLPGFTPVAHMPEDHGPWLRFLADHGHDVDGDYIRALSTEPERPADLSMSTWLTDRFEDWLADQRGDRPWFAHLSYLRPHPPYAAAGEFASTYDPADMPLPIEPIDDPHPLHAAMLHRRGIAAPRDPDAIRRLRAQYLGMVSEVDAQLLRVWSMLERAGMWDDTVIVVTADHADQLGDHGLIDKPGWFEECHHILGIVRDPRRPHAHGTVVDAFTENVDVFPTICDAIGLPVPSQCDGLPLTPFLDGVSPSWWRDAAHWEYDWRDVFIDERTGATEHVWPWDRRLERQHLAVLRDLHAAYVQFGDGSWLAFDLDADPTWRTSLTDPARVLDLAQRMLVWRSTHADRTHTSYLIGSDGPHGRRPADVDLQPTPLP